MDTVFSRPILKRVTEFVYSDAAAQVRSEALVVSPLMCLKLKVLSVRGISDQIKALIMLQPGSMNIFRFSVNSDLCPKLNTQLSQRTAKRTFRH